ncbi:hypothetical protein [Azospirillum melinis]
MFRFSREMAETKSVNLLKAYESIQTIYVDIILMLCSAITI